MEIDSKKKESPEISKMPGAGIPLVEEPEAGAISKALEATKWLLHDTLQAFRSLQNRVRQELSGDSEFEAPAPEPAKVMPEQKAPEVLRPIQRAEIPIKGAAPFAAAKHYPAAESGEGSPNRPLPSKESFTRLRRVLVVGSLDFFGAAIVHELHSQGAAQIDACDDFEQRIWQNLPNLPVQEYLQISELQETLTSRLRSANPFSQIFFLGKWTPDRMPIAKDLLLSSLKSGARFTSISSASSIGTASGLSASQRADATNFRPQTSTGVLAAMFDRFAIANSGNRGLLSLKHYRLFGPGEQVDSGIYGLATRAFQQIRESGKVTLPKALKPGNSTGDARHDFFPVSRAASMVVALAKNAATSGVYEIGSGKSYPAVRVIENVFEAMGKKPDIVWDDSIPFVPPSPQPVHADLTRVKATGISIEEVDLKESIAGFVKDWLRTGQVPGSEVVTSASGQEPQTAGLRPAKKS